MCGQKGGVKNGKPNAGGEKKGAGQKKNGADEELGRKNFLIKFDNF